TTGLYKVFETWKNDYSPHSYEIADSLVEVQYFGHPCDRPKDLRARPFMVRWITQDRQAPHHLDVKPKPVFRVELRCLGNCDHGGSSDDSEDAVDVSAEETDLESNADSHSNDSESGQEEVAANTQLNGMSIKKERRPKSRCLKKVQIHVEVRSDDLANAVIYQ
ncbi:hypothetical protein FPV67DRAFT_1434103, partial [Lyophyllum atratum]